MNESFDWNSTTIEKVKEVSDDVVKNPWKYLQVSKDDDIDHIKRMYRMLARKYHPDMMGSLQREDPELCHERMVQLNRAYDAIQRLIGTKSRWEASHYDPWRKDDFDFDGLGKETIDIESFEGEIARYTKMHKESLRINAFFHKEDMPYLNFGTPDESFETGFGQSINLYQLFIHLARKQGTTVAPIVVKPFLEFHKLDGIDAKEFADTITSAPVSDKGLRSIMKKFKFYELLNSRGQKEQIREFMYDVGRLMDITQFWWKDRKRFEKSFIYGAGITEEGGLEIYRGWEGVDTSSFTKNDFDLMKRLVYGDNLLPEPTVKEGVATYRITKFGIEEARKDAEKTYYEQISRETDRWVKGRKD
jgi:hypothetical protein